MANLSRSEKLKLESIFDMKSGYVLNFSNRTFKEFFEENYAVDIYDNRYAYESGSKANRLRAFWWIESNHIVGKLIVDLLEYLKTQNTIRYQVIPPTAQILFEECQQIAERLLKDNKVENIDVIQYFNNDKGLSYLVKSIKDSIKNNEPEAVIDRLHTYVIHYIRQLCNKHKIAFDKNDPLHCLFGKYVNYLSSKNIIDSKMTKLILKSNISILDSFNKVRNEKSLAHDNPILNYNESILIINNVTNILKYIESIEED